MNALAVGPSFFIENINLRMIPNISHDNEERDRNIL